MRPHSFSQFNVDLRQVKQNYLNIQRLNHGARVACVVKDNAYGIGAVDVAKAAVEVGCQSFFVAYPEEAVALRKEIPTVNIYSLQGLSSNNLEIIKNYNITPVISTLEEFYFWKQANISEIKPAIQVETGLNRMGFRPNELAALSENEKNMFSLCMSHLACSDTPEHPLNKKQLSRFMEINKMFGKLPLSLSASKGAELGEEYHCDLLRIGAHLYGINLEGIKNNSLKQVLSVFAPVLQLTDLNVGDSVSYDATYVATEKRKIAIVGIGYGDGLFRSLSCGKGVFYHNGKKAPILGKVCMDATVCDVTDIPELKEGDLIEVLGNNNTADDMAQQAGTIAYDIISRFGKSGRFKRNLIK